MKLSNHYYIDSRGRIRNKRENRRQWPKITIEKSDYVTMATILEAIQNANYNINKSKAGIAGLLVGKSQLSNAAALLDKEYDLHTDIEEMITKYGSIDKVPEKTDNEV